jgi:hypothetical protein
MRWNASPVSILDARVRIPSLSWERSRKSNPESREEGNHTSQVSEM